MAVTRTCDICENVIKGTEHVLFKQEGVSSAVKISITCIIEGYAFDKEVYEDEGDVCIFCVRKVLNEGKIMLP